MLHDLGDAFRQRRNRRFLLRFFVGTSLLALLPFGVARWQENRRLRQSSQPEMFPFPELARLDAVVQARFAEVPTNDFGMGRIGPRHELFRPVKPSEQVAIDSLHRVGQEVVFFVAGRNYLQNWPTAGGYPASLQGPVYMTKKPLKVVATQTKGAYFAPNQPVFHTPQAPSDLPSEAELREPIKEMLNSSSRWDHTATLDSKTFIAGTWNVMAVPVRATKSECVGCHNHLSRRDPPRLGDPLGIALYAYHTKKEHK